MKKHIVLCLALLSSAGAQAQLQSGSIQAAIAALEKTVHRGPAGSPIISALTALQTALSDLNDTHDKLTALKRHLLDIVAAVDSGIKDLDEEIKALAIVAGVSETAPEVASTDKDTDEDDKD